MHTAAGAFAAATTHHLMRCTDVIDDQTLGNMPGWVAGMRTAASAFTAAPRLCSPTTTEGSQGACCSCSACLHTAQASNRPVQQSEFPWVERIGSQSVSQG